MNSAPQTPHPWIARLLPSLTDVAFLMPVVFLFTKLGGLRGLLGDGDTGWHVRTGEWMLAHHQVPRVDFFSYTMAGKPWFAWEWLWDLIFGWLHLEAGLTAVVLASLVVLCFTFALLYRLALRRSGNPILSIIVTFFAAAGSSIHWHARPHLFTLLFVVIFLSLLERVRDKGRSGLLWCLPALMIVWTNLHGGFFLGIVLVWTYAAGELTKAIIEAEPEKRRAAVRRSCPYLTTALGCIGATFANPYGYELHRHVIKYLGDSKLMDTIQEFQSLSFHSPAAHYFEPILLIGCAAIFLSLRKKRCTDALLLIGFAHLGLMASRSVGLYLIVAAPIVALSVTELMQPGLMTGLRGLVMRFNGVTEEIASMDQIPRLHLVSIAALLLLVLISFRRPSAPEFEAAFGSKMFPVKAAKWLEETDHTKGVFTLDQWGDYLVYSQYPQTKVFFDGRSDFYGSKFTDQYVDVLNVKHGWEEQLLHYGVETVLLPADAPLAGALKQSSRWLVGYDDGRAIIFNLRSMRDLPTEQIATRRKSSFVPVRGTKERRDPWIAAEQP